MTPDPDTHHHPVVHQALDKFEEQLDALSRALGHHDKSIMNHTDEIKRTRAQMGEALSAINEGSKATHEWLVSHDLDLRHAENKITDLTWRLQRTRSYLWFMFGWVLVSTPLIVVAL